MNFYTCLIRLAQKMKCMYNITHVIINAFNTLENMVKRHETYFLNLKSHVLIRFCNGDRQN